ncbi:hypothetical protein ARMSODRAFT_742090 [Armillaria solidipes]|uniref:Uncharacterized protein n=1 Tax=Armillaria solidipes TaxID=1076256 RepID=A0A2H3C5K3_9AGAR|nr:hypothetical protein ARMSODRAFT_742090 [Armillaria solidipes]
MQWWPDVRGASLLCLFICFIAFMSHSALSHLFRLLPFSVVLAFAIPCLRCTFLGQTSELACASLQSFGHLFYLYICPCGWFCPDGCFCPDGWSAHTLCSRVESCLWYCHIVFECCIVDLVRLCHI